MRIWIETKAELLSSLASHWSIFVFFLVTGDNVIDAQQQDGGL